MGKLILKIGVCIMISKLIVLTYQHFFVTTPDTLALVQNESFYLGMIDDVNNDQYSDENIKLFEEQNIATFEEFQDESKNYIADLSHGIGLIYFGVLATCYKLKIFYNPINKAIREFIGL